MADEEISAVDDALSFFVFSIAISVALIAIATALHAKPSMSFMLFVIGVLCGLAGDASQENGFGAMIYAAEESHPHVILFLLLPPLLFYSSLTIDFHMFWKCLGQSVMLAGPGVFLSLFLIAPVVYLFNFGWTWGECFLLSAILSATDPVSVTSALHQLGAPEHLRVIIEGESLLNDGTAYVFFLITKELASINAPVFDMGNILLTFLQLAFGGLLWGYLSGSITNIILMLCPTYTYIQSSIIVGMIYLIFILAETIFHVSGVLAVVTFGIYMSAKGKYGLSPEGDGVSKSVIQHLDFWCGSVIFPLAGAVVFKRVFMSAVGNSFSHWLLLIVLFIILNIVRFSFVFLFAPILRRMGKGMSNGECIIVSCCGLRGAVALSLSLAVHLDTDILELHRNQINFFVAGIVCLSLLINGPVTSYIYEKLNLYPVHPFRTFTCMRAIEGLEEIEACNWEDELRKDDFYSNANWRTVRKLVPSFIGSRIEDNQLIVPEFESVSSIISKMISSDHTQDKNVSLLSSDFVPLSSAEVEISSLSSEVLHDTSNRRNSNDNMNDNKNDNDDNMNDNKNDDDDNDDNKNDNQHNTNEEQLSLDNLWSSFKRNISVNPLNKLTLNNRRNTVASEILFSLIHCQYDRQFEQRYLGKNAMLPLVTACKSGTEYGCNDNDNDDNNLNMNNMNNDDDETSGISEVNLHGALKHEYDILLSELHLPISDMLANTALSQGNIFRSPARWLLFTRLSLAIEALTGYIRGHNELIKSHHLHVHLAASSFFVMKEYMDHAQYTLNSLQIRFPVLYHIIQCLLAARSLLLKKRKTISGMIEKGLFRERDGHEMLRILSDRLTNMEEFLYYPITAIRYIK